MAVLKNFFENIAWWTMTEAIRYKTRYFQHLCTFMQKRMLSKIQTLTSKVDVIR